MTKKYLPFIMLFVVLLIVLSVVFSFVLYKSFCRLDQIVNWDAVSALSSIFMALTTVGAIFIAIYIPRQDRITSSKINLFEARFESYFAIYKFMEEAYLGGYTKDTADQIEKMMHRSLHLINETDWIKLKHAAKEIISKSKENDETKREPKREDIESLLEEIHDAFSSYLSVNEFGIEPEFKELFSKNK